MLSTVFSSGSAATATLLKCDREPQAMGTRLSKMESLSSNVSSHQVNLEITGSAGAIKSAVLAHHNFTQNIVTARKFMASSAQRRGVSSRPYPRKTHFNALLSNSSNEINQYRQAAYREVCAKPRRRDNNGGVSIVRGINESLLLYSCCWRRGCGDGSL